VRALRRNKVALVRHIVIAENLGIEKETMAIRMSSSEGRARCASYDALLQIATDYVEAGR
jgi:hypothetical protein